MPIPTAFVQLATLFQNRQNENTETVEYLTISLTAVPFYFTAQTTITQMQWQYTQYVRLCYNKTYTVTQKQLKH